MPIVADVNADLRVPRLKRRVSEIPWLEEIFLPEPGRLRDVILPVFAEVRSVGVDDSGGVVINARHLPLIYGNDDHHLVALGNLLHQLGRRSGHGFSDIAPLRILTRTEVRAVENFLKAEDLN